MKALATLLLFGATLMGQRLPDPRLTPGVTQLNDVGKICKTHWGKDARHVTDKMKRQVCAEYRERQCPGPNVEIDHLVSREVGGADELENLWPQPAPEYRWKDQLENYVHKQVCARKMTLAESRECLVNNWFGCYQRLGLKHK